VAFQHHGCIVLPHNIGTHSTTWPMNASPFPRDVATPASRLPSSLQRVCDLWLLMGCDRLAETERPPLC